MVVKIFLSYHEIAFFIPHLQGQLLVEKIIGVNIHPCNYAFVDDLQSTMNVGTRCFELVIWANVKHRLK